MERECNHDACGSTCGYIEKKKPLEGWEKKVEEHVFGGEPTISGSPCSAGLSDEAQKTYGSLIPGRWYQTIGHFPDVKELIEAGLVETELSPITWAKGPAVKRPKDT